MRKIAYIAAAVLALLAAGCSDRHSYGSDDIRTVSILRKATLGNGVNIVILGDAYLEKDLAEGGAFLKNAETIAESFFSFEPVASMQDYFNVYAIGTPSLTDDYNSGTATYYDLPLTKDGSSVDLDGFDEKRVWRLIRGHIPGITMKNVVVILHQNGRSVPRDRCLIVFPDCNTISFVSSTSPYLISHESVGHGLALLADEYVSYEGSHPGLTRDDRKRLGLGYGENVDFTDDRQYVKWKHFFAHPDYHPVGLYEGGMYYKRGVWRSEPLSIMSCNVYDYFNARSRELIYRRVKDLAGERFSWEEFLEADRVNLQAMYRNATYSRSMQDDCRELPGTMPPSFRFAE